jgi:hypothetical protein
MCFFFSVKCCIITHFIIKENMQIRMLQGIYLYSIPDDAEWCLSAAPPPAGGLPRPQLPQDHWGRGRAARGVPVAGARTPLRGFLNPAIFWKYYLHCYKCSWKCWSYWRNFFQSVEKSFMKCMGILPLMTCNKTIGKIFPWK